MSPSRIHLFFRRAGWSLLGTVLLLLPSSCAGLQKGQTGPRRPELIRALWVTRWDYRTPEDIAAICRNARSVGVNTLLFQVRGQGTVCYRSRIEPWADEFGGRDPGFDPLAVAVREAHSNGLALHAWINTMPAWKGKVPPANPLQLYNAHPEGLLYDARGHRQPLSDYYVMLNPAYPEVRQYLVGVCHEIITRYDVDGLHLDYIRFVLDESGAGIDYPHDRRTLALYRQATGLTPEADPIRWDRWRADQVSLVVDEIGRMKRNARPHILLTAAVFGDRRRAYDEHLQDPVAWVRSGAVDAIFPMAYRQSTGDFARLIGDWRAAAGRDKVIPGIGIYMIESDQAAAEQLSLAQRGGNGFALYAYSSLFPSAAAAGGNEARRRTERLRSLLPLLKRSATG